MPWINLAQKRDMGRALVKVAMNIQVLRNVSNFFDG